MNKRLLGIMGRLQQREDIVVVVLYLDVDYTYPRAVRGSKGLGVHQLKCILSWVDSAVKQLGLYVVVE